MGKRINDNTITKRLAGSLNNTDQLPIGIVNDATDYIVTIKDLRDHIVSKLGEALSGVNATYASLQSANYVAGINGGGWKLYDNGYLETETTLVREHLRVGGYISSYSYNSGALGSGFKIDAQGHAEVESLSVRTSLTANEFIIKQITGAGGAVAITNNAKVKDVIELDDRYTCVIDFSERGAVNQLMLNDLVRCQVWDGNGIKYYRGKVIARTNDTFDIAKPMLAGTDVPEAGDHVFQFGNDTDENRQGLIYLTNNDTGAPYIDVYDGVNSINLTEKLKVRLGKLNGVVDADFDAYGGVSGYGLYAQNVYLKGKMIITGGNAATHSQAQSYASAAQTAAQGYADVRISPIETFTGANDPLVQAKVGTSLFQGGYIKSDVLQLTSALIVGGGGATQTQLSTITSQAIRYIRDWQGGVDRDNQWYYIKAFKDGVNVITPSMNVTTNSYFVFPENLLDGDDNTYAFTTWGSPGIDYAMVDLGQLMQIDSIAIKRTINRVNINTKTEVSTDGNTWVPVYDSKILGTYQETASGRTFSLAGLNTAIPAPLIGGKNYYGATTVIEKNLPVQYWNKTQRGFIFLGNYTNDGYIKFKDTIDSNGWWTISFDASAGTYPIIINAGGNVSSTYTIGALQKVVFTTYINNYTANKDVTLLSLVGGWYNIDNFKIEKGTTWSDWTIAEQDITTSIDSAAEAATDAQLAANNANTLATSAQTAALAAETAATSAQTSATTANALLADLANDNKLTAVEKQQLKVEWDSIISEVTKNDAQADAFLVSRSAYDSAFTALSAYITPLLDDITITSDIVGGSLRTTFRIYYDARTDLLNAIATKAKAIADTATTNAATAQTTANAAQTTATGATSTANAAQTAANSAQTTANAASSAVATKITLYTSSPTNYKAGDIFQPTSTVTLDGTTFTGGKVYITAVAHAFFTVSDWKLDENVFVQASQPYNQTSKVGAMWIDTISGNVVKVFDGTTWNIKQDSSITTAYNTANAAQTTANTANTTAVSANTTAVSANTTAIAAQNTANSKTKTVTSATQPSGSFINGDIWQQTVAEGVIYWQYLNGVWVRDYGITSVQFLKDGVSPYSSTEIINGLVLTRVLGVKNSVGVVTAYINGSSGNPNWWDVAIAAGVTNFGKTNETRQVDIRHNGYLNFGQGKFVLDTAGNITMYGSVYATSGSFTGAVNATSGSFTGAIYANSGNIGALNISNDGLYINGSQNLDSDELSITKSNGAVNISAIRVWADQTYGFWGNGFEFKTTGSQFYMQNPGAKTVLSLEAVTRGNTYASSNEVALRIKKGNIFLDQVQEYGSNNFYYGRIKYIYDPNIGANVLVVDGSAF